MCRKAVKIPGGFDPLFWGIAGAGAMVGLAFVGIAWAAGGWPWGLGVLLVLAIAGGVCLAVS
jgi:hypothetical protein